MLAFDLDLAPRPGQQVTRNAKGDASVDTRDRSAGRARRAGEGATRSRRATSPARRAAGSGSRAAEKFRFRIIAEPLTTKAALRRQGKVAGQR